MAMQIRLSKDVEDRAARGPMTVDEFLARFPEVPRDLRDEPLLAEYVSAFGHLLRLAQKPAPCVGGGGDAPHQFYLRLVNDLAVYGIGLARRDRTLPPPPGALRGDRKEPAPAPPPPPPGRRGRPPGPPPPRPPARSCPRARPAPRVPAAPEPPGPPLAS